MQGGKKKDKDPTGRARLMCELDHVQVLACSLKTRPTVSGASAALRVGPAASPASAGIVPESGTPQIRREACSGKRRVVCGIQADGNTGP